MRVRERRFEDRNRVTKEKRCQGAGFEVKGHKPRKMVSRAWKG